MAAVQDLCWVFSLFVLVFVDVAVARCPKDYRHRVELCVLDAQVAPQAGGGLPLITDPNKLEEICERGILRKSIDCLTNLQSRCADNERVSHELSMLFSLRDWTLGQELLCEDLHRKLVFKDHFECVSKLAPRISGCILIRTQMFRREVTDARLQSSKTLHDITCNFAENIVNCLARPLARACPVRVVDTLVTALHRFLPPACAPVPAVTSDGDKTEDSYIVETIITEGGDVDATN